MPTLGVQSKTHTRVLAFNMDVARSGVFGKLLIFLAIVVLTAIYLFYHKRYNYWKKWGIHYEKPFFIFGNLSYLMRKSTWVKFKEWGEKNKMDYFGLYLTWQPVLIVQSPTIIRNILVKDHHHFKDRYSYTTYESDPLGSMNLFSVKSPLWSNLRHELSPMFTANRLKMLTEFMNHNAKELVNKIKRDHIENDKRVDMKELFSMYSSDTVGYTVFGIYVSALKDPSSPLWYITQHMVKWTLWRGFEFTMIFILPFLARLFRLTLFTIPASDYVKKIFWNTVNERKANGMTSSKDLVSQLLQLKQNLKLPENAPPQLADDIMFAQAAVFILGSVETSSTIISYCLHELAYHPDEQEKLYREIDDAIKATGKEVLNYEDLMNLKYLSACIHETLRKYPPLAYMDRMCNKDYRLNEDFVIEAGVPVFINVVAIHYNEEFYPEPKEWKPERMMNMNDSDNRNFTYLPFGEGPRFCIGKRYGLMQIRAAIAQMVHKYKFEPIPDEPYQIDANPYTVILSPNSGGQVKFIERK